MTQAICAYPIFAVNLLSHALDSCPLYELFDDALADLLGLITFRHGTSPASFYSIMWTGGQPRLGGRPDRGENALFNQNRQGNDDWNTHGKFFVIRDTIPVPAHDDWLCTGDNCYGEDRNYEVQKFQGDYYRRTAIEAELKLGGLHGCNGYDISTILKYTPIVKFRFTPQEAEAQPFRRDDTTTHNNAVPAYCTELPVSPDHIGICGTLVHGLNFGAIQRAQADPERFWRGLYKMAWAVMYTALIVLGFTLSPVTAVLTGAYLAYFYLPGIIGSLATPIMAGCGNVPQLEELA